MAEGELVEDSSLISLIIGSLSRNAASLSCELRRFYWKGLFIAVVVDPRDVMRGSCVAALVASNGNFADVNIVPLRPSIYLAPVYDIRK